MAHAHTHHNTLSVGQQHTVGFNGTDVVHIHDKSLMGTHKAVRLQDGINIGYFSDRFKFAVRCVNDQVSVIALNKADFIQLYACAFVLPFDNNTAVRFLIFLHGKCEHGRKFILTDRLCKAVKCLCAEKISALGQKNDDGFRKYCLYFFGNSNAVLISKCNADKGYIKAVGLLCG